MPKSTRLRILAITHSPTLPSGMAETTRLIFNAIQERYPDKYDVHQIGLKHVHAVTPPSWPIYPTRTVTGPDGRIHLAKDDLDGEQTFRKLLPQLKPDIVFAFNDPQHVGYLCSDSRERKYKLILYVNFDGFPVPPDYHHLFAADRIITMSRFAMDALIACHPSCAVHKLDFIYAPADTVRFKPASKDEKRELRGSLCPAWMRANAFILGWVGMNQWRKQVWAVYHLAHLLRSGHYLVCSCCAKAFLIEPDLPRSLGVFSGVEYKGVPSRARRCPYCQSRDTQVAEPLNNVFVWFHMVREFRNNAWPVDALEALYNLRAGDDIYYTKCLGTNEYLTSSEMPALFKIWDALLYLSGGEGFGVPAWEAISSGLPVIYTRYSSHSEFLENANAGLPVGGVLQPEPVTCTLRLIADMADALNAVRRLYSDPEVCLTFGRNGRAFVEQFTTSIQAERWHRTFQEIVSARQEVPRA